MKKLDICQLEDELIGSTSDNLLTLDLNDIVNELTDKKPYYEVDKPEDLYKLFLIQYKFVEEAHILYKKTSEFYKELMKYILNDNLNVKLLMPDLAEHFYGDRSNTSISRVFRRLHRLLEVGLFVRIQDDLRLNTHIYIPVLFFLPDNIFKRFYVEYLDIDYDHELIREIIQARDKFIQILNEKRKRWNLVEYIPGDYGIKFTLYDKVRRYFSIDPEENERVKKYLKYADIFRRRFKRTGGYLGGDLRYFLTYVGSKNSKKLNYYLRRLDKRWLVYDRGTFTPAPLMYNSEIIFSEEGKVNINKVLTVVKFILNLYKKELIRLKFNVPDIDTLTYVYKEYKRYIYMTFHFVKRDYPELYKGLNSLTKNIEEYILFSLFNEMILDIFKYLPSEIWYDFYKEEKGLDKEEVDRRLKYNAENPATVLEVVKKRYPDDKSLSFLDDELELKPCRYTKKIEEYIKKAEKELEGRLRKRYEELRERYKVEPTKYNKLELENYILDYFLIHAQIEVFKEKFKEKPVKEGDLYIGRVKIEDVLYHNHSKYAIKIKAEEIEYRFKYFIYRAQGYEGLERFPDRILKHINKFEFFMKIGGILMKVWKAFGINNKEREMEEKKEKEIKEKEEKKKQFRDWFNKKKESLFSIIDKNIIEPKMELFEEILKESNETEISIYKLFDEILEDIQDEISIYLKSKHIGLIRKVNEFAEHISKLANDKISEILDKYSKIYKDKAKDLDLIYILMGVDYEVKLNV